MFDKDQEIRVATMLHLFKNIHEGLGSLIAAGFPCSLIRENGAATTFSALCSSQREVFNF